MAVSSPPDQNSGERMMHFDLPEVALQNPQTLRALEAIGPTLQGEARTHFDTQIREQLQGRGTGGGDGSTGSRR